MIYYERNGITIHHGDCKDTLPYIGDVDLVITDPPYGMNYVSGIRKDRHQSIHGDNAFPIDMVTQLIDKASRASYVCCRWNNLYQLPPPKERRSMG